MRAKEVEVNGKGEVWGVEKERASSADRKRLGNGNGGGREGKVDGEWGELGTTGGWTSDG